jgi:hypothetical protein
VDGTSDGPICDGATGAARVPLICTATTQVFTNNL